jgi:hypothetical protein
MSGKKHKTPKSAVSPFVILLAFWSFCRLSWVAIKHFHAVEVITHKCLKSVIFAYWGFPGDKKSK